MVIQCRDIAKSFGHFAALDRVTLTFSDPAIVGIIGPNGAGKTTLLNILTGLEVPDAGSVLIDGINTTDRRPQALVELGIGRTFQHLKLVFHVSVIDNVLTAAQSRLSSGLFRSLFGLDYAKEASDRDRAAALLSVVGLDSAALLRAGDLSYGQQKLLSIACVLATGARVLMLDEPIAGLDPAMSHRVLSLLSGLRSAGSLVVIVEHDIEAITRIADRLVVIDAGRIIADGSPGEVLTRPEVVKAYVH